MSIQIGPIALKNNVVLAPLSGISDAPFRRMAQRFGVGMTVSEMVASRAVVDDLRRNRHERRKLMAGAGESGPRAVQLAGCDPQIMAEAAKLAADQGAEIIDINFGCPAKKVVNAYAGSALMADEVLAGRILEATVKAVSVPVTLKMRMGWRRDQKNAPRIARIAESVGIKLLTVHGRTRDQGFGGSADWAFIAEVKAATTLPLLVNGDILNAADARQALKLSGADGVMIGRGACGQPWRPGEIALELAGTAQDLAPRGSALLSLVLEHYDALLSHYGAQAGIRLARKHLAWYLDHFPGGEVYRRQILTQLDPQAVCRDLALAIEPAGALAA